MPYPAIDLLSNIVGFSMCQVSVTHPTPAFTVAVIGTADPDLNPVTYSANYVGVANAYNEQFNSGEIFTVQADGRVLVNKNTRAFLFGYADVSHSANNSTVGAVFSIERGGSTILTPRAVHSKMPNAGDIGNISGAGAANLLVGDIVSVSFASNITGSISIRSSSLIFVGFGA